MISPRITKLCLVFVGGPIFSLFETLTPCNKIINARVKNVTGYWWSMCEETNDLVVATETGATFYANELALASLVIIKVNNNHMEKLVNQREKIGLLT